MSTFDDIVNRRGSGSYKWDSSADPGVLPLWVADMDFRTATPVIEALRRRVDHGIFGYTLVGPDYYDALTGMDGLAPQLPLRRLKGNLHLGRRSRHLGDYQGAGKARRGRDRADAGL